MGRYKFLAILLLVLTVLSSCRPPSGGGGGDNNTIPPDVGSIAGRVSLPERVQLDSDTRDPINPSTANNTLAQAQEVTNLVMVLGNAAVSVDPDDYFLTSLNAGETVKLVIGDTTANLDLSLYQSDVLVTSSTNAGNLPETINSPAAGVYKLRVHAVTGGSNYQLQIGTLSWSALHAAGADDEPTGDFVPGEVLVKLKDPGITTAGAAAPALRNRADGAARRHQGAVGSLSPHGLLRLTFDTGVPAGEPNERDENRRRTLAKVKELQTDPDVLYAEPNFIVRAAAIPSDTHWAKQWDMVMLNLPAAWDMTTGSSSVIVAVVDTGVLYDHPDLAGNVLKDGGSVVGYDFISDVTSANDGDGPDPNPYDSGDRKTPTQSSFHGSHVSGTIGAVGNNATGVAGVNWNVRIMPVRVLGRNDGSTYDVAQGILYAAGLSNSQGVLPRVGGTVTPADVINLSLGGSSYSQTMQDAISMARSAGVTVVAAAGNESSSSPFYPAAGTGVIAVSALDLAGNLAPYSNYGTYIDLAAPGGNTKIDLDHNGDVDGILSTLAVGLNYPTSFNYVYYQGTSMAAPHVSGIIALMKAYHNAFAAPGNELTPAEIDTLITGTATGIDSITNYLPGHRDNYLGYGLIDALKAVQAAAMIAGNTAAGTAVIELSPAVVDFGFSATSAVVNIVNGGAEPLAGITVSPSTAPWLTPSRSGQVLTLNAVRAGLTEGYFETNLTVSSTNGGSAVLTAKIYKGTAVTSTVGGIYVALIDQKGKAVDAVATDLSDGYLFSFVRLKKGKYQVIAGTDLDNDGLIGDPGEFFGIYPSLDTPLVIDLTAGQDLTNRNFGIEPVSVPTSILRR